MQPSYHFTMKLLPFCAAMCSALSFLSCANKEVPVSAFDYSAPVNLTSIYLVYDKAERSEDFNTVISDYIFALPNTPQPQAQENTDLGLIADTSFVLRLPEYANSEHPFLANAEDYYNACLWTFNVWNDVEIWAREPATIDDVMQGIKSLNANIIKDKEVRHAAQHFVDSLLLGLPTEKWSIGADPTELYYKTGTVITNRLAYRFYGEDSVAARRCFETVDSVRTLAKNMKMYTQMYSLKGMLDEFYTCKNFDEQCALWFSWANRKEEMFESNIWLAAVGIRLMESDNYNPRLFEIWQAWRAICQTSCFGESSYSLIPNNYYNEYRKRCYLACLKRIEQHPDDVCAMNCAALLAGQPNLARLGIFGNASMEEQHEVLPERFKSSNDNDNYDDIE